MKILMAPDKFKDALSAMKVCEAMRAGLDNLDVIESVYTVPMADGGEGTMEALTHQAGGYYHEVQIHDPLGRPKKATIGLSPDRNTAFLEMASASGLQLLDPDERNCFETSSFGTGELILEAFRCGVKHILLGVGGSATCDGGMGMAAALGYKFYDSSGRELPVAGKYLREIAFVNAEKIPEGLSHLNIRVACDVNNPLTGTNGAAQVFGPQKGADNEQIEALEEGLQNIALHWEKHFNLAIKAMPGSGAAGGLAGGVRAFLGGDLQNGVNLVMEQVALKAKMEETDLVITGEGKLDEQTINGKVVYGVAKMGNRANIPVIALCGTLSAPEELIRDIGLSYATSIIRQPASLKENLMHTERDLTYATFQIGHLLKSWGK